MASVRARGRSKGLSPNSAVARGMLFVVRLSVSYTLEIPPSSSSSSSSSFITGDVIFLC